MTRPVSPIALLAWAMLQVPLLVCDCGCHGDEMVVDPLIWGSGHCGHHHEGHHHDGPAQAVVPVKPSGDCDPVVVSPKGCLAGPALVWVPGTAAIVDGAACSAVAPSVVASTRRGADPPRSMHAVCVSDRLRI